MLSSSEPAWIVEHILLDSLLFSRLLPAETRRVLDLGSGAGVPGVPLKVVLAEVEMTLLEARAKRASFLSTVVRELALTRCEVVNARIETIASERGSRYDAVVMRCAGDPVALSVAALPVLRAGGVVIASGPPKPRPTPVGGWQSVEGPHGTRRFWMYRKEVA